MIVSDPDDRQHDSSYCPMFIQNSVPIMGIRKGLSITVLSETRALYEGLTVQTKVSKR
jgi:hypothetical protein